MPPQGGEMEPCIAPGAGAASNLAFPVNVGCAAFLVLPSSVGSVNLTSQFLSCIRVWKELVHWAKHGVAFPPGEVTA